MTYELQGGRRQGEGFGTFTRVIFTIYFERFSDGGAQCFGVARSFCGSGDEEIFL
jgi:hypothetical protein